MVCPILISLGVTPRISAAAKPDDDSIVSAPMPTTLVRKRIAILPFFFGPHHGGPQVRFRPTSFSHQTCHGPAARPILLARMSSTRRRKQKRGVTAAFVANRYK